MKDQAPHSLDYLSHYPDAVQDVDMAHEMALASTGERYRARVWRQSTKLAIEAVRAAENMPGEAGDYELSRANYYIYDKGLEGNAKANGLTSLDVDMAHNLLQAHQEKLSTEEGRQEVSERYARMAERTDEVADAKEEAIRSRIEQS